MFFLRGRQKAYKYLVRILGVGMCRHFKAVSSEMIKQEQKDSYDNIHKSRFLYDYYSFVMKKIIPNSPSCAE